MKPNRSLYRLQSVVSAFSSVIAFAMNLSVVQGAAQIWDGGTDSSWDSTTGTNWGGVAWTNGNDAVFGPMGVDAITNTGVSARNLTFNTTGYTIAGGALTLTGATPTITTGTGVGTTISSVIDGTGGLTKAGAGTLTISATNTYTGATQISAGTLQLNGSTAAGSTVGIGTAGTLTGSGSVLGNATLTGGGVINLTNPGAIAGTLGVTGGNWNGNGSVVGAITSSSGTFTIGAGANLTVGGGLNVAGGSLVAGNAASTITGSVNYTSATSSSFGGVIAGLGNTLTMNSAGTTLTLTGVNTYTSSTTITAGTLQVDGSTSLSSIVAIGTAGTLSGSGTVNGHTTLTGNGVINMSSGSIRSLQVYGGNWNGNGSVTGVVFSSSGTFTIGAGANLTVGAGLNIAGGNIVAGNTASTITGRVSYTSGTSSSFSGVIAGAGNTLSLNSAGATLALGGVNTYSGATQVYAGTLQLDGSTAAGSTVGIVGAAGMLTGSGTVNGNSILAGNGVINKSGGTIAGTLDVADGNWNGNGSVTGLVTSSSGTFTIGAGANLTANEGLDVTGGRIVAGNTASTITGSVNYASNTGSSFNGVIAGAGKTLTMNAPGTTLVLSGSNTYTGATTVTAGTLAVDGSTAAGSPVGVGTGGTLSGAGIVLGNTTLTGNGVINLSNPGTIAGSLGVTGGNWNGAGSVTGAVTSSSGTFTIGAAANLTANGGLNVTGGTLSGSGTVTGTTSVTGGAVNGTGLVLTGVTTINGPGNILNGTVTSTAGVTLAAGATLAHNGALTGSLAVGNGTLTGVGGSVSAATTLNGGTINLTSGTLGGTLGVTGGNWNGAGSVTGTVASTSGTFTIGAGANLTAAGGLNVTGGGIAAGNASSMITGSLNYTSGTSSNFGGVIAGAGILTLNNAASTLTLSGSNTYTGLTTITAGTLMLTGSLTSSVAIASGAALVNQNGGLGASSTVTNAGTLTHAGPDTINTLVNSGTIKVTASVSPGGNLGFNATSGIALLSGSQLVMTNSTLTLGQSAVIFNSPSITGSFDAGIIGSGLRYGFNYATGEVQALASRPLFATQSRDTIYSFNSNQTMVAGALFEDTYTGGAGNSNFHRIYYNQFGTGATEVAGPTSYYIWDMDPGTGLTTNPALGQLVTAITEIQASYTYDANGNVIVGQRGLMIANELSPEVHRGMADYTEQAVRTHVRAGVDAAPVSRSGNMQVFASFDSSMAGSEDAANNAGYDTRMYGLTAGMRYDANKRFQVGGLIGADDGTIKGDLIDTDAQGMVFGIFGSYLAHDATKTTLTASASYGIYDYDAARRSFGGMANANGIGSDALELAVEARTVSFEKSGFRVIPNADIRYITGRVDGFTESGPGVALQVNSQNIDSVLLDLGVDFEYQIDKQFSVVGKIGYSNALGNNDYSVSSRFAATGANGSLFSVSAPGIDNEALVLGFGAYYDINGSARIGLTCRFDIRNNSQSAQTYGIGASYGF